MPDGTKPLPEPVLTNHQWVPWYSHKSNFQKYLWYQYVKFQNYTSKLPNLLGANELKKIMFVSTSIAFLTDLSDSDMLKVHPSRKGKKASNFKESLIETKRRGIESCVFPGFRKRELTELPGQLEAPQILNRVTKAQDFNVSSKIKTKTCH